MLPGPPTSWKVTPCTFPVAVPCCTWPTSCSCSWYGPDSEINRIAARVKACVGVGHSAPHRWPLLAIGIHILRVVSKTKQKYVHTQKNTHLLAYMCVHGARSVGSVKTEGDGAQGIVFAAYPQSASMRLSFSAPTSSLPWTHHMHTLRTQPAAHAWNHFLQ